MEKEPCHINISTISCIISNLKVSFSLIENPKVWNIFYLNHGLVLELEFNEFARGKWEITELEFAEMLMRYTDSWDMDEQIKEVKTRLKNQQGNHGFLIDRRRTETEKQIFNS